MDNHEGKPIFSLTGFSNILILIAAGFFCGFSTGLMEDNSYHFAVIVGGHTSLSGLLTYLICYSINNSSLLDSFPRLKTILTWSIVSGSFSGMNAFIVNASPYINNKGIMGNTVGSLIKYAIFGALAGYISTLLVYKKKHKAT